MVDGRELLRRAIIALASTVLLVAGGILAVRSSATDRSGPDAGRSALPSDIRGRTSSASTPASVSTSTPDQRSSPPVATPVIPVAIDIPISSTHYPQGVHARVMSHPLNADNSLYVPADPEVLNWASNDAAPGADHGTAIITGHVNYVIDGHLVIGALADLGEYAKSSIGSIITVHAKSGPTLRYRIIAGREYSKDELAGSPSLRTSLYNQTAVYGPDSHPTGRLLLVSCGGAFDPATGEYEDNVFLYALPVS
jgi:hypothetical protein